jgi:hypothetical protein
MQTLYPLAAPLARADEISPPDVTFEWSAQPSQRRQAKEDKPPACRGVGSADINLRH